MKKISQITLLLLIGLKLSAQYVWIDSIRIIPISPTMDDTVLVIGEIRTASAGCDLDYTEMEIDTSNKLIKIKGCYAIGPLDTICPSIDTFQVGQLPNGNYQIILTVNGFETIVNPNGDCSNSGETTKVTEVMVSGTNSTGHKTEQPYQFNLINNPVKEFAIFQVKQHGINSDLVIADNLGRIVLRKNVVASQGDKIKIEVSHLASGIYYCYLENDSNKTMAIKMIKD
ncbi:MAG TPA: hypothetical protein DCF33_02445 [Saprospirales bacterium]|nr:hypothetical protein [Saprospirales bacterium]